MDLQPSHDPGRRCVPKHATVELLCILADSLTPPTPIPTPTPPPNSHHFLREAKRGHQVGVLILLHLLYRRELLRKWGALQRLSSHAEEMRILELNTCATTIQSLVRSYISRRHDGAARVLQAWAQRKMAALRFIRAFRATMLAHRSAKRLQKWLHDLKRSWAFYAAVRRAVTLRRDCATIVQQWYRRRTKMAAFNAALELFFHRRRTARRRIQRAGRMYGCKLLLRGLKREHELKVLAALRLQVFVRKKQGTFSTHVLLMALSWGDEQDYREKRALAA